MPSSSYIELNNNDDLLKVIKKCNTNFRNLGSQKQQQDRINSQSQEELKTELEDEIAEEAELRAGEDERLDKKIDDLDDSLATVAKTGDYDDLINKPTIPPGVTVDDALSTTSENPVQNKVITDALNNIPDASTKVSKTGDQMTGDLDMMNRNVRAVDLGSSFVRNSGNPVSDVESNGYQIRDTYYNMAAKMGARRKTDGTMEAFIRAYNDDSGTEVTEEFSVGIDRNGDAKYGVGTPSALLKALGLVTNVDTSTSYIGVGSTWTLWSAEKRRFGNVITVNLQVSCSSALTAGTTYPVGTVPAAWRPATNVSGTCSEGIGVLTYQGAFSVCPFRNIASATAFRLYFTFIV